MKKTNFPTARFYHVLSFLEPADIIDLIWVSSVWRQDIINFKNTDYGQTWRNNYCDFKCRLKNSDQEEFKERRNLSSNLMEYYFKAGKNIGISLAIGIIVLRKFSDASSIDLTKELYVLGQTTLALTYCTLMIPVGSIGIMVHQAWKKCKREQQLKENQKALTKLTLMTNHTKDSKDSRPLSSNSNGFNIL